VRANRESEGIFPPFLSYGHHYQQEGRIPDQKNPGPLFGIPAFGHHRDPSEGSSRERTAGELVPQHFYLCNGLLRKVN